MKLAKYDKFIGTYNKRTSHIFYICDLRSGHFHIFPLFTIMSQWANNQLPYIYFSSSFVNEII